MAGVTIENVKKSFSSVKIVRNQAEDGEFVVLVGRSGCGKSALCG
jgi:ABC-type sugar transport system ATPase subunit